jgi:hypothetical protein
MNMNIDNAVDNAKFNLVENYFLVEFVSVPPNFDISNFLTLREQVGQFDINQVELNQIKKIADAIKFSPVVSLLNNALLNPVAGFYLLSVLDELGLVVKSITNPLRKSGEEYKRFIKRYNENSKEGYLTYIRGQETKRVNIIIINLFQMMNQNVIDESLKIANDLQKYQIEVDKKLKEIGNLD